MSIAIRSLGIEAQLGVHGHVRIEPALELILHLGHGTSARNDDLYAPLAHAFNRPPGALGDPMRLEPYERSIDIEKRGLDHARSPHLHMSLTESRAPRP